MRVAEVPEFYVGAAGVSRVVEQADVADAPVTTEHVLQVALPCLIRQTTLLLTFSTSILLI